MLAVLTTLAQADAAPKGAPAGFDIGIFLLIGVSFVFFIILPMRRDKRQRQDLVSSIERGDRVIVNGAIVGVVDKVIKAETKGFEDELLLKIDENAGVKMRVLRSSVTRVVKEKKEPKEGP